MKKLQKLSQLFKLIVASSVLGSSSREIIELRYRIPFISLMRLGADIGSSSILNDQRALPAGSGESQLANARGSWTIV